MFDASELHYATQRGELVILPTDTVYGIGADPFSREAVTRLLSAKGRTETMPPPVLAADWEQVESLVSECNAVMRKLGGVYWPGPLTLVAPTNVALGWDLAITGGTIAIRIPGLELTREILKQTGPLAVTSANLHGQPPATNLAEALAALGDVVAAHVDGGQTPGPVPSSIVDVRNGKMLRSGILSAEQIVRVLM